MANQIGNSNNVGNPRSRFDTNKLGPNGAMPTRNGIRGQSFGHIVRAGILPQDKVELTQETIQKNSYTAAAQTKIFSVIPEQIAQIQDALYASAQASPEEALQAHQLPDYSAGLNAEAQATQLAELQASTQATPQETQAAAPQTSASGVSLVSGTEQTGGGKTAQDVLDMLREMMPGWVIATGNGDWQPGFRNIQIDHEILERMANDPAEMERVMDIISGFEELVPQLEQWAEENTGKSLILRFLIDDDGNLTGLASIRTLLGLEGSADFDLSGDRTLWIENMFEIVGVLTQDSRNWTA